MVKKNTIRLTESELKQIITESVKNTLTESIKVADPMNAVSKETAESCGFQEEYSGIDGGFEIWSGPLPQNHSEQSILLRKLGIKRFTSTNYSNGTCRITVDPSGKIASLKNEMNGISKERLAQLAKNITLGKVSPEKAIKYLVNLGYSKEKTTEWVKQLKNQSMKDAIEVTESKLKQVIAESVKKILKEDSLNPYGNGYGYNSFQVEEIARDKFFKLKGFDGYNGAKSVANNPNDDRLTLEQFEKLIDEWLRIAQKHNERSNNNYTTHIQDGGKFKMVPDYSREAEEKRFRDYTKDEYERRARKKRIGTWREKDSDYYDEYHDMPQKQPWR